MRKRNASARLNTQKPRPGRRHLFFNHISVLLCSPQVTAVPTYPTTRTKTPSASWFALSPRRKVCAEPQWCQLWATGHWVSCGFRGKHSASLTLSPSQMIHARKGIVGNTGERKKNLAQVSILCLDTGKSAECCNCTDFYMTSKKLNFSVEERDRGPETKPHVLTHSPAFNHVLLVCLAIS